MFETGYRLIVKLVIALTSHPIICKDDVRMDLNQDFDIFAYKEDNRYSPSQPGKLFCASANHLAKCKRKKCNLLLPKGVSTRKINFFSISSMSACASNVNLAFCSKNTCS